MFYLQLTGYLFLSLGIVLVGIFWLDKKLAKKPKQLDLWEHKSVKEKDNEKIDTNRSNTSN